MGARIENVTDLKRDARELVLELEASCICGRMPGRTCNATRAAEMIERLLKAVNTTTEGSDNR